MTIIIAALILCYNVVNMYTDIRWRITKNVWHLLYFLFFLSYAMYMNLSITLWLVVFAITIPLLFGLALEKAGSTGPGDTKMMITNALGICALIVSISPTPQVETDLVQGLLRYGLLLSLTLLTVDAFRIVKNYGFKSLYTIFFRNFIGVLLIKLGLGFLAKLDRIDTTSLRPLPGAVMIGFAILVSSLLQLIVV